MIWAASTRRAFLALYAGGTTGVYSLDGIVRNGKLLWQSGVTWTEKEPTSDSNPPCTPSPVTDGQRVIAWFGSAGVYCYDFVGHELWRRDLGQQTHQWGYAASLTYPHGQAPLVHWAAPEGRIESGVGRRC